MLNVGAYLYLSNGLSSTLLDDIDQFADRDQAEPVEHRSRMDPRLYGIGAQILRALGVKKMRLHVSYKRPLVAWLVSASKLLIPRLWTTANNECKSTKHKLFW